MVNAMQCSAVRCSAVQCSAWIGFSRALSNYVRQLMKELQVDKVSAYHSGEMMHGEEGLLCRYIM